MSVSDSTCQQSPNDLCEILLVEDNPGDVRLIREAFTETDGETRLHVVTNGEDAINFLRQEGAYESVSVPDFVLLDLNLPGKDGFEVLKAVQDEPHLEQLPVIILTGSNSTEDIVRCYESRANAYVTKPTDPDEFISIVESVVRFWCSLVELPPT